MIQQSVVVCKEGKLLRGQETIVGESLAVVEPKGHVVMLGRGDVGPIFGLAAHQVVFQELETGEK